MWFQIDHCPTIYMFYNDLRFDFKIEMILHIMKSNKGVCLMMLELELSFRAYFRKEIHFKCQKTML